VLTNRSDRKEQKMKERESKSEREREKQRMSNNERESESDSSKERAEDRNEAKCCSTGRVDISTSNSWQPHISPLTCAMQGRE
jgi:hypothetical protein